MVAVHNGGKPVENTADQDEHAASIELAFALNKFITARAGSLSTLGVAEAMNIVLASGIGGAFAKGIIEGKVTMECYDLAVALILNMQQARFEKTREALVALMQGGVGRAN